jgi:thymidylate synthase
MFKVYEGESANDVWVKVAKDLSSGSNVSRQEGRNGPTREILHAALSISNPLQRWIPSRFPAVNPAFALAEVIWILRGRNDAALPTFFFSDLPKFQGEGPTFDGAYGHRLRRQHFDQIDRAYKALAANPASRQVVLQIWDCNLDLPFEDGSPQSEDIPCNTISLLKIRNGRLDWTQIMRSNDGILGLPQNIVQFTSLQEIMAGWLGVVVGEYHHYSDSLHAYEDEMRKFKINEISSLPNIDSLAMHKSESDLLFTEIESRLDLFIRPDLTISEFRPLIDWSNAPSAYQNILCVLAAETARRKGWKDLAEKAMEKCNNPALMQLWDNWFGRVGWRTGVSSKRNERG